MLTSGLGTRFEALQTAYESHTFAPHSHDTYTLGLVLHGTATFWCRGAERFASKGDLVVIPPGEVHTGSVGSGVHRLSYLALYLPVGLAALHAEAAGVRGDTPPEFGSCVLRDPVVRAAYRALDEAIGPAELLRDGDAPGMRDPAARLDDAAAQENVCVAITELIRRHALRRASDDRLNPRSGVVHEPQLVRVVRDVLENCYARADETSLRELAQRVGASPFRVIRAFRAATGLTPHQYLIQVRVEKARQLLAGGAVPSLAALKAGFADQSHLTHHFKRHLGITPATYRRCVTG